MAKIYDIVGDFLQLQEMLSSREYDEETLQNTLDCIEEELEIKAENYAKIIKNLEGDTTGLKSEEERLAGKRKGIEGNIKRLKEDLYNAMKVTGKEKFKTTLFSFGIQKNSPTLKLIEGEKIPGNYLISQDPKVDNAAIREALKNGEVFSFAELHQGESLRIR